MCSRGYTRASTARGTEMSPCPARWVKDGLGKEFVTTEEITLGGGLVGKRVSEHGPLMAAVHGCNLARRLCWEQSSFWGDMRV